MPIKTTLPLVLQNLHYNLLNECNSVILALKTQWETTPVLFVLFCFPGFFLLCRNQISYVEKKNGLCQVEVTFEKPAPRHF